MILSTKLVFTLVVIIALSAKAQQDCNTCTEIAPPNPDGTSLMSCLEQKELGKCERGWMEGYCECTCGPCGEPGVGVAEEEQDVVVPTQTFYSSGSSARYGVDQDSIGVVTRPTTTDSDVVQSATQPVATTTQVVQPAAATASVPQSPSVGDLLQLLANTSPKDSPIEACECSDLAPSASRKTCTQLVLEDQCEMLLSYGFCECSCGKCDLEVAEDVDNATTIASPAVEVTPEAPVAAVGGAFESAVDVTPEVQETPQELSKVDPTAPVELISSTNAVTEREQAVNVDPIAPLSMQTTEADVETPIEEVNAVELVDGQKLPNQQMTLAQQDDLLAELVRTTTTGAASVTQLGNPASTTQQLPAPTTVTPVVAQPSTTATPQVAVATTVQRVEPMPIATEEPVPMPAAQPVAQTLVQEPVESLSTVRPPVVPATVTAPMEEDLACIDVLPPESEFSCAQWKAQGKCDNKWMEGYCLFTCEQCGSQQDSQIVQLGGTAVTSVPAATPQVVEIVTPTPVPAAPRIVQVTTPVTPPTSATSPAEVSYQELCMSACNDNPPPNSDYSCAEQKRMGKCSRDWMTGYCECTCETCDAISEYVGIQEQKSVRNDFVAPQVPVISNPAPVPQVPAGDVAFKLTVLHFNDIHARLMPATEWWWECEPWRNEQGACYGGFPRMKTIVDQTRAAEQNVLLLNGGDDFVGTDWDFHDPQNKATTHFLNIIGVDAMAIGNHEFDHGPDTLATFSRNANYPLLSCNMDASKQPNLQSVTQKYTIKNVGGYRIGIFGLTTTFTNTAKHADPRGVWFSEPNYAAQQCVQELRNQGVNMIIALSHLGYSADKYLAKQVDGIDLVVGSHSHTFLTPDGGSGPVLNYDNGNRDGAWGKYPTWIQSDFGKRVPVVQAGWATRYLGKLTMEFDTSGNVLNAYGQPILLGGKKSENNVPEDYTMKQQFTSWKWWQ
eukprot:TRINITY_DN3994_c0_g3_i1.p1 TRINITY_DN3994_c0_g3~~TRINITY_DN3994_c0_g3_i1.p1  ORF type:complete len:952 (+),score=128.01 TRINITY_DN3994_c0_g3_i1:219-3074(+)